MTVTSVRWNRLTFETVKRVLTRRVKKSLFYSTQDKTWDTRHDEEFALQSFINQEMAAPRNWGDFFPECGKILQPAAAATLTHQLDWFLQTHHRTDTRFLRKTEECKLTCIAVCTLRNFKRGWFCGGKKKRRDESVSLGVTRCEKEINERWEEKKGGKGWRRMTAVWWKHVIVRC